ncbi:MAG TPA: phosphoenolpyruvate carboxylase, partial [Planctomycetaceae bacterium]|nr:phosphoenolpyruvate carboxylase [Planctomycetaceae bacterium]
MTAPSNDLLRRDVRLLGDLLGDVIKELVGPAALQLVEEVRHLSRRRRSGEHEAEPELARRVAGLDLPEARVVSRAFSIFFDLANLAEDRHRIRVLRSREQERDPAPISESIGAGIEQLHK